MIGVFTVDIGKVMKELREEREREIKIIEDINNELRKICGIEEDSNFVPIQNYAINDDRNISIDVPEIDRKIKKKEKKKINKAFKGTNNERDYREGFEANENAGIRHADDTRNA